MRGSTKIVLVLVLVVLAIGSLVHLLRLPGGLGNLPGPDVADSPALAEDAAQSAPPPRTPVEEREDVAYEEFAALTDDPDVGFTLLVIDQESEQPLGGVEVWIAPIEDYRAAMNPEGRFIHPDEEQVARELGQRRITDTNGVLRLKATAEVLYVSGRAGELWGEAVFRATARDSDTLELRRDHRVEIEVVDEAGAPCGEVPVALLSIDGDYRDFLWIGRTDADEGRATIPHYQMLVYGEEDSELFVVLAIPLPEPMRVPVVVDPPPTEPLRLTLPSTGSLAVEVLNEKHRAPDGRIDVRIGIVPAGTGEALGDAAEDPRTWIRCENGGMVFAHVGLGLELEVAARSGEGYKTVSTRVLGPRRPGQRVEVLLRLLERNPTLTGRVLDPEGDPLVDRELFWRVHLKEGFGGRGESVQTDHRGRFRAVVDSELTDQGACELQLELRGEELPQESAFDLPLILPAGELDLGDLQLEQPPVALAGRVVEGKEEPVAGVGCELCRKRFSDSGSDQYSWRSVADRGDRTDEAGAFLITGELEQGEYGLRVNARGFPYREPFPVHLGDRQVLIRLERGGAIAGSVLLDPLLPGGHVLLTAVREMGGGGRLTQLGHLEQDGLFLLENLLPGRWEVLLQCGSNLAEPLIDPVPVEVVSGQTARPPSLQQIELRSLLHVLELRVVDDHGEAPESTVLYRAAGETETAWVKQDSRESRIVIVDRWPALDLLVTAPGRRDEWLEGVSGELDVTLRPALPVRLRLTGELELPDEDYRLIARLRPVLGGMSSEEYVSVHRDFVPSGRPFEGTIRDGEAELTLSRPGSWRLEWLVERQGRREPVGEGVETSLEIRDVETDQELEVSPPAPELLEEALSRSER